MFALFAVVTVIYLVGIALFFFRMRSAARNLDPRSETIMTTGLTLAVIVPFGLGVSGGAMAFGSQTGALAIAVLSSLSFVVGLFLIPSAIFSGIEGLKAREREECNERFNQLMRQRVEERKARVLASGPSNKQRQVDVNIPR